MKKELPVFTEDQKKCIAMLAEWSGGAHHLPRVHPWGVGVCINHSGDLSTYDFNRLTELVVLSHRDAIRIEIRSSGPRLVRIIAHKRMPMDGTDQQQWERHPTLAHLAERISR